MPSTVFSHPRCNVRQVSLGNTALVNIGQMRNESDLWCLGYLQDIEHDHVLIDLDCAQFPPFWVSAQYVWYHHLVEAGYSDQHPLSSPGAPLHAQVALRNEPDGPFVFRPAQLLSCPSVWNMFLCCVTTKIGKADCGDAQEIQVVHHWQVVQSLPTTESPLFGRLKETGSLSDISVLKQTVHTEKVSVAEIYEERQVHHLVWKAVKRAGFGHNIKGISLHPRVFVAIDKNSIMVLLFDLHFWRVAHGVVGQQGWTVLSEQKFAREIEENLEGYKQATTPKVRMCNTCIGAAQFEPMLGILPWELLSEVLLHLDFHFRTRAKRVSSAWHLLLSTKNPCTILDLNSVSRSTDFIDANAGYRLGTLLDRAVSRKTRSLVLCNIDVNNLSGYDKPSKIMKIIRKILTFKKVQLVALILKNCRLLRELREERDYHDFMAHELHHISELLPLCQKLFLLNHTTIEILGWSCGTYRSSKTPQCVTAAFPYMEFHRSASGKDTVMQFVRALETYLPPVDEIKASFKERHQHFVQTLPYPEGWQGFRQFLKRHAFIELATMDSFWIALDLRNFDQLPLTKMALFSLGMHINMGFGNMPL